MPNLDFFFSSFNRTAVERFIIPSMLDQTEFPMRFCKLYRSVNVCGNEQDFTVITRLLCLKKNQNTPRPSEHLPVMGGKMSKRLGGIKGCKYKISSWHLNRFPDADNIGSFVIIAGSR